MAQEFLEHHVRLAYRTLRHKGYATLCHAQNMQTAQVADRRLVTNENDLVTWAKSWNGRANIFLGRNPRVLGDDKTLAGVTAWSLDIDPIRAKGTASSLDQVAKAVAVGKAYARAYPGGSVFASGNGCQVLHTFPIYIPQSLAAFREQCRQFKDSCIKQFTVPGIEIDHVHEAERLMKLPGTLSTKGDRALWRVARFLDDEDTFKDGSSVLRAILSQGVSQAPLAAPTAEELGVKSKSEAQFAMAAFLKAKGYKAEQVLAALRNSPYGKANRDDDNVRIVQKVFSGQATVTNGQVVEKTVETFSFREALEKGEKEALERGGKPEMPTGFRTLDELLWSLRRGNILTVGARPGVGKTLFALRVSLNVARLGKKVLFFSTEMPVSEIAERLKVMGAGLDDPIQLCDLASPTVEAVRAGVEKHAPDLLVLDFIQHTGDGTSDSRYQELSKFVRDFHNVAREHNCTALVLSQLSRVAASEEPQMHHLKECGTIEEESSAVLLLHRLVDDPTADEVPLLCKLDKWRHGKRGRFNMLLRLNTMEFIEQL